MFEVRRSRHGKAALVVGGKSILKFIMLDGNGPKFGSADSSEFYSEFNKTLVMTEEAAAISFLKAVKQGFRHNAEVIQFLMKEILMKNLSDLTLDEIVTRYNSIAVSAGKKPRKSFDSKAAGLAALEKLDAEVGVATPAQEQAATTSTQRRSNKMNQQVEGTEVKEVKARGKGIGTRAMELLIEGKSTQEVIDTVKAEIPDANPTGATIAWYKNKLRQEGKLAKPVKKEKVAKADKVVAEVAEGEVDQDAEGE